MRQLIAQCGGQIWASIYTCIYTYRNAIIVALHVHYVLGSHVYIQSTPCALKLNRKQHEARRKTVRANEARRKTVREADHMYALVIELLLYIYTQK